MERSFSLIAFSTACVLAGACSRSPAPPAGGSRPGPTPTVERTTMGELPDIDVEAVLARTKQLSSDRFEGRAPGTNGEDLTVAYLIDQFKTLGLRPGNTDGTFTQKVPLVGITADGAPLVLSKGADERRLAWRDDVVAWTKHVAPSASIDASELVFVGYGVVAPEYDWDDYKGLDVKGKTLVMLVNDPPVVDPSNPSELDPKVFGGRAMTYYGRWTYKFEIAADKGAAAVFIVHETAPASYPFTVVQGSNLGEKFDLVTADKNMGRSSIEGWVTGEQGRNILSWAGQNFDELKTLAATRDFTPVPLGITASMTLKNTLRNVESRNVLARLEGRDPLRKNEFVVYTAHWDHLGVGPAVDGDRIYNGAKDNAVGVAGMLEIARAFTKLPAPPKRSVLFIAVTAEEQGLLGSAHYAAKPDLSAGAHGRDDQHRRSERPRTDPRSDAHRIWRIGPRRLRPRRDRRTGARHQGRSGTGQGLLLPVGPLQLREAGRAGAACRRRGRFHRQAASVRPGGAGRVDRARLSQAVGRREAAVGPARRPRGSEGVLRRRLSGG